VLIDEPSCKGMLQGRIAMDLAGSFQSRTTSGKDMRLLCVLEFTSRAPEALLRLEHIDHPVQPTGKSRQSALLSDARQSDYVSPSQMNRVRNRAAIPCCVP